MVKVNRWFGVMVILCVSVLCAQDVYSGSFGDGVKSIFKKETWVKKDKSDNDKVKSDKVKGGKRKRGRNKREKLVVDTMTSVYGLSLSENIYSPLLQEYSKDAIKAKQQELVYKLMYDDYNVTAMRDGEVVMVSIAAEDLFLPNDTVLMDGAAELIQPLVKCVNGVDGYYKVLLAMHSDDTGSQDYKNMLCAARVKSVGELFDGVSYVVSYAAGDSAPLLDNKSVKNRAANRRLEVYFIPYKAMIVKGEKGTL